MYLTFDDIANGNVLCIFIQNGNTPLHGASKNNHVAAIEVLLKNGTAINQINNVS